MKKLELYSLNEKTFSKEDMEQVNDLLKTEIDRSQKKIIVLDDDPTGTQTVHGISVYTDWSKENISAGFDEEERLFYILTNSRALTELETKMLHEEITKTILEVSKQKKKDYIIISRSDSTLRGHFPLETQTIQSVLERDQSPADGEIICPFFLEGGRYTIGDIHYVQEGRDLIPASETEFAKDKTFGYVSSNLKAYIEEKTNKMFVAKDVVSISLEMLRSVELDKMEALLAGVNSFNKVIVNAVSYEDLKVFGIAFYRAVNKGKRFIIRSAASLVKVLGGISDKELLNKQQFVTNTENGGGLVVVGSYAEKTTRQLEKLKDLKNAVFIEFNSDCVLNKTMLINEQSQVVKRADEAINAGHVAVIFTKRKPLQSENDTKEEALVKSVMISEAVASIVKRIETEPKFIIAKGGITSSDVATKALDIKRATVLGQIQPGVPVWRSETEGKHKNLPYVIFPGNVGSDDTLMKVIQLLTDQ